MAKIASQIVYFHYNTEINPTQKDKLLLVAGNTQLLCLAYKRTVKCLVQKSPDFFLNFFVHFFCIF